MLTPQQKSALAFIARYQRENHLVTPTYQMIAEELGLTARSGIHRIVSILVERGCIRRLPHKAQAIEVMPLGLYYLREAA